MSSSLQEGLAPIISGFALVRNYNYVTVAVLSFLAYDYCISFSSEVEFIWRSRWSAAKCLYLFARYFGLAYLLFKALVDTHVGLSNKFCDIYPWVYSFTGTVCFTMTIQIIFILRIHALYDQQKKVLVPLIVSFFLEVGADIYCVFVVVRDLPSVQPPLGLPWPGCMTMGDYQHISKITLISWVPFLLMSSLFFGMTLFKLVKMVQSGEVHASGLRRLPPLLSAFVRDGVVFFFLIFFVILGSTIVVTTPSLAHLSQIMISLITGVDSYAGSHLILNLRVAGVVPYDSFETHSMQTRTISDFRPRRYQRQVSESGVFELRSSAIIGDGEESVLGLV